MYDGTVGASNAYTFTIRATDDAGNSSDLDVRIEMEDAIAPLITGVMTDELDGDGNPVQVDGVTQQVLETEFTVAEGFGGVVADFGATDTSSVVFSLSNNNDVFTIDQNGGVRFAGGAPAFDADGTNDYTVTINATDAGGLNSTKDITVSVTDDVDPLIQAPVLVTEVDGNGATTFEGAVFKVAEDHTLATAIHQFLSLIHI